MGFLCYVTFDRTLSHKKASGRDMSGGHAAIELNCRRPAAVAILLVHVCDHGEEIPLRYTWEQCFAARGRHAANGSACPPAFRGGNSFP